MSDPWLHLLDATVVLARRDLVEDAPTVSHKIGDHTIHVVRLRMRAVTAKIRVVPERVEKVLGFRAFVHDDAQIFVTSIISDMSEQEAEPFDIACWVVSRSFASHVCGLISWLFPLEVTLSRRSAESVVDLVVVTHHEPYLGKIP